MANNATQALNNSCHTDKHDKENMIKQPWGFKPGKKPTYCRGYHGGDDSYTRDWKGLESFEFWGEDARFWGNLYVMMERVQKGKWIFLLNLIMSVRKMRWLRRLKQARWRDAPPPVMSRASTRSPGNGTHVPLRAENRWAALNQEGTSTNPFIVLVFRV